MIGLNKYWILFEKIPKPTPFNLGCGITAHSVEDAKILLDERVLRRNPELIVKEIKEGVVFDDLEKKHVRPNIGDMSIYGIWFPQGF